MLYLLTFFSLQNIIYPNSLLKFSEKSEKVSWSNNWKTSLGSVRDGESTQKPWNKKKVLEGPNLI